MDGIQERNQSSDFTAIDWLDSGFLVLFMSLCVGGGRVVYLVSGNFIPGVDLWVPVTVKISENPSRI